MENVGLDYSQQMAETTETKPTKEQLMHADKQLRETADEHVAENQNGGKHAEDKQGGERTGKVDLVSDAGYNFAILRMF